MRYLRIMRGILLCLFIALPVWMMAQEPTTPKIQEGQFTFDTDKPFTVLELYQNTEEPIVTKKKKPRRKVFYGIKTRKRFSRGGGYDENAVLELFYILKKPEAPHTFARDIYWYEYKTRKIRKTTLAGFKMERGILLHGPYKKMQGEVTLEEGVYFKGTKHARWTKHNRQDLLEDKEKYYKGWPKESIVTYYDPVEKKKIKEITPVEYGEKEGFYYLFHENGQIAVMGEYRWNERVNDWIENYPSGKRKRIISYPKESFAKNSKPYIRKEWDEAGTELYSR